MARLCSQRTGLDETKLLEDVGGSLVVLVGHRQVGVTHGALEPGSDRSGMQGRTP